MRQVFKRRRVEAADRFVLSARQGREQVQRVVQQNWFARRAEGDRRQIREGDLEMTSVWAAAEARQARVMLVI